MDNAGCHPPELLQGYSNIKIIFLPTNTTSKLQPLDLGIINNFKVHYRRFFLKFIAAKIDTAISATEVTKSVNVLTAIRWVALAWKEVNITTIQKCFKSAGILCHTDFEVQTIPNVDDDPFQDVDGTLELSSLISHAMGDLDQCSVQEYTEGETSLPVCVDLDYEWNENFLSGITREDHEDPLSVESDGEDGENMDISPPVPKIVSFKEAIQSIEDVQLFLENRGLFEQASSASLLLDQVTSWYLSCLSQVTLDHYLEPAN